jgi:L-threonylcarbamoyladenylate synthase
VKTLLTTSPEEAAAVIKNGGIAAFPTETVYGLGANVFDVTAIEKVFTAKGRPADNPLIAHIAEVKQIELLAAEVTDTAKALIEAFFPGPLTVVLKKRAEVPDIATAGLDTIGIRMPAPDLTREFLKFCETPVVAPSANVSGRPSPTTWQAVLEDLDGRIDCILQGDATDIGIESTVVDCTQDSPVVLRPGSISLEEIRSITPNAAALSIETDGPARSPGLRHRHYTPRAMVMVAEPGNLPICENAAYIGLEPPREAFAFTKVCSSVDEYAASLYEFFRECDRRGMAAILCESVRPEGVGTALMDRIKRAAEA